MKNTKILFTAIGLILLATIIYPAAATQPKLSYSWAGFSVPDPNNPGTRFISEDNVMHVHGSQGFSVMIGTFGSGTSVQDSNYQMNLLTYTGSGIGSTVDTYSTGTMEGIVNLKFKGVGVYTYHGPTLTIGTTAVTDGTQFVGALLEGTVVKHGTSGALSGLQLRGQSSGVSIGTGLLKGVTILTETGTYWINS